MVEERDEKRITLRIPTDVYEAIVATAKSKHLSLNSYILQILTDNQYVADLELRMAYIEQQIGELQREKRRME